MATESTEKVEGETTEHPLEQGNKSIGDFLSSVKEKVSASTTDVLDRAKTALVEKELVERKDAFLAALNKLQELQREGKKIKPDDERFDADGKLVSAAYSKAKVEELKKHKEQVAKVEKAIAKAFEGDFSKLKEAAQGQK